MFWLIDYNLVNLKYIIVRITIETSLYLSYQVIANSLDPLCLLVQYSFVLDTCPPSHYSTYIFRHPCLEKIHKLDRLIKPTDLCIIDPRFVSGLCLFQYTNPQNLIYWQLQIRSEIVNFRFQPICVSKNTPSEYPGPVSVSSRDSLYLFVYYCCVCL